MKIKSNGFGVLNVMWCEWDPQPHKYVLMNVRFHSILRKADFNITIMARVPHTNLGLLLFKEVTSSGVLFWSPTFKSPNLSASAQHHMNKWSGMPFASSFHFADAVAEQHKRCAIFTLLFLWIVNFVASGEWRVVVLNANPIFGKKQEPDLVLTSHFPQL